MSAFKLFSIPYVDPKLELEGTEEEAGEEGEGKDVKKGNDQNDGNDKKGLEKDGKDMKEKVKEEEKVVEDTSNPERMSKRHKEKREKVMRGTNLRNFEETEGARRLEETVSGHCTYCTFVHVFVRMCGHIVFICCYLIL